MDQAQIVELAKAIASQTVFDQWPYWVSVLAIGFLVSLGGGFLGAYVAKRAEVQAEKDAREEILAGLRATTKAAEEVKSSISLGEWNERERRTVRRNKLEELVLLAHKVREWQIAELDRLADPNLPERPNPQSTMAILGRLYFPELKNEVRAYDRASDVYSTLVGATRIQVMATMSGGITATSQTKATQIMNGAAKSISDRQQDAYKALLDLEYAASALMEKIIAPPA